MTPVFADIAASALRAFHDSRLGAPTAAEAPQGEAPHVWHWIDVNHRCNRLLWDEEDLARRTSVAAAQIVANKRAIDTYNQQRNDAIERIDELLLARLEGVIVAADAWHNSETAGSIIDRLSILALKILHMDCAAQRAGASAEHRAPCRDRHRRLCVQRDELADCFDALLMQAAKGAAFWRVYRQFKMYNDPSLNPQLYRGGS
ncbi:MAG: DUF4254 domain-containing protein [Casimicrobiaceae bacterium]